MPAGVQQRPRQALSTVHGGAIIGDLLLLHGDEIEPPGRDVVDGRQRPLVRRHI